MQILTLQNDTVVPYNVDLPGLVQEVAKLRTTQLSALDELRRLKDATAVKFSRIFDRAKRYIKQRFDGLSEKATQGRRRSRVNKVMLERAVLYQLSRKRCSLHHACRLAFVKTVDGYKNMRCLYDYCKSHQQEFEEVREKYQQMSADEHKSAAKLLEVFDVTNASLLQGMN